MSDCRPYEGYSAHETIGDMCEEIESLRRERDRFRKDYLDVADAIAKESSGPADLIRAVRDLRECERHYTVLCQMDKDVEDEVRAELEPQLAAARAAVKIVDDNLLEARAELTRANKLIETLETRADYAEDSGGEFFDDARHALATAEFLETQLAKAREELRIDAQIHRETVDRLEEELAKSEAIERADIADVKRLEALVEELVDEHREHDTGCPGWYRAVRTDSDPRPPVVCIGEPCDCGLDDLLARARAAIGGGE